MGEPRSSWKRLYTLDFTAQSTDNTIGTNGTHVIDGKTWTTENGTAANSINLTNGTGLVFDTKSGAAAYGDNVRTCAIVTVPLTSLIGNVSFARAKAFALFVRATTTASVNFQFAQIGIEWSTTPTQYQGSLGRGFSTSLGIQSGVSTSAVTTRHGLVTTTDDVLVAIWRPDWNWEFRRGALSGGLLPAVSNTTFYGSSMGGIQANVMKDSSSALPRVFLSSSPTGAASGFLSTFTHLAVEELVN